MNKKTDLRVVKTKAALRKAFVHLLDQKPFEQISIKDITEAAMINRSTFYLHYQDKYDLMEILENETVDTLVEFANLITPDSLQDALQKDEPLPHLIPVMKYIDENSVIFQLISKRDNGDPFFTKVSKVFSDKLQQCLHIHISDDLVGYCTDVSISVFCAILNRWVKSENHINIERLAYYITNIIKINIHTLQSMSMEL